MHKIAVVVGHNERRQGAVRKDNGETEFAFNSRVAKVMQELAEQVGGYAVKVFYRQAGGGYSREIADVYRAVDAWGADVSMELHFNSLDKESANGCETLSSGTVKSLALAQEVNDEIVRTFGVRDRGVRTRASSERGGGSLHAGRAPAILTEPFFGSNPSDLIKFAGTEAERKLAGAYLKGAMRALYGEPAENIMVDEFKFEPDPLSAPLQRTAAREPVVTPTVEEAPVAKTPFQSTTIRATVLAAMANGGGLFTAWSTLTDTDKMIAGGLAAVAMLALLWIFSERIKKMLRHGI